MPDNKKGIRSKVDDFFTNYLRSTTSDQEILDFYGEGNIVGRKGIPTDDKKLLDSIEGARSLINSPLRPKTDRPDFAVGGIDQSVGYEYTTKDIPGLNNPSTGRPWQMTFGVLPKDFGAGSLTPAAHQFLVDFRVPRNSGSDYSFATGPNIKDRIDFETKHLLENDPYFGRQPERLEEKLNEIKNKSAYIGDYGGQPMTPKTWQELGYITDKPANFKENVLRDFKNRIFENQKAFGGVSTLTPVEQASANNPMWRAELYEKTGLAGPLSEQRFSSGYGGGSRDVQRFTTGNERLLPLQPYSEFFKDVSGSTPASVVGNDPAPDFTPFQKAVGTRNYLIGRNILQGRGSLGAPVRTAQAAPFLFRDNPTGSLSGAAVSFLNPEVAKAVKEDKYASAAQTIARDVATGALAEAAIKTALPTAQRYAPSLVKTGAPIARFAGPVATGAALFSQGQTGSLTDVVTQKASRVIPGLKPNPKTDLGRRAGNELMYMFNQLQRGRLPYFSK